MDNFNQIIDKLKEDYALTVEKGTGDAYSRLSTIFEELGAYMREYLQDLTEDEIKSIISKLKKGEDLDDVEKHQIRLWIVGDAEDYTQMENNYQDWQDELKRLLKEIDSVKGSPADLKTASRLRGLFRDASRVLADIFYFVEQKDRIEKFNMASQNFGPAEREVLVRLLEQKIKSPDF